jgi:hypothetical protein
MNINNQTSQNRHALPSKFQPEATFDNIEQLPR